MSVMGMVTSVLWGRLWARWAVGQVFGGELLGALGLPAFGLLVWVVLVPWSGGSSFWGWLSVGARRSWGWSVVGLVAWLAKRAPTTCSFVWLVLVAGKGVNRRMLVKSRLLVVVDLFSVLLMMEEADAVPWMVALST